MIGSSSILPASESSEYRRRSINFSKFQVCLEGRDMLTQEVAVRVQVRVLSYTGGQLILVLALPLDLNLPNIVGETISKGLQASMPEMVLQLHQA